MTQATKIVVDNMTRQAWKAQKTIREISEWRTWVERSTDEFLLELARHAEAKELPRPDVENLALLREQLLALKKSLRPLEKGIDKSTGQRIRRTRTIR
jgi:hypothetical protein